MEGNDKPEEKEKEEEKEEKRMMKKKKKKGGATWLVSVWVGMGVPAVPGTPWNSVRTRLCTWTGIGSTCDVDGGLSIHFLAHKHTFYTHTHTNTHTHAHTHTHTHTHTHNQAPHMHTRPFERYPRCGRGAIFVNYRQKLTKSSQIDF